MFTVCPKCLKQFRLYAEHIAAAAGQVRCGFCDAQFNALEHLHDEPLSNEIISKINQPETKLEQELVIELESENNLSILNDENSNEQLLAVEPEFDIPNYDEPEELSSPDNGLLNTIDESNSEEIPGVNSQAINSESVPPEAPQSDQDLIISNDAAKSETELDTAIYEIGVDDAAEANKIQIKGEAFKDDPLDTDDKESHYDFPESDQIFSAESSKRRWMPTLFWASACVIGLIGITLQLVWFNRDLVSMKYPQITTYIKQVCDQLDCRILRHRDTQAIKLVNRDVRLHPNYQDTLLVNATINNQLPVRQPYPRVQLTLFDTSGALLGHRKFTPSDYLDESIELDEGMPINIPVHFVLEVVGPTAGAVSFEFRFL